jgi:tetratricopeptide (TPR) repeat protein
MILLSMIWVTQSQAITTSRDAGNLQLLKYEKLLERNPSNKVLLENLKDMVADIEFMDVKIKAGRLGLKYSPQDNELRFELAEALLETNQLVEATKEFDMLLTKKFWTDKVLVNKAIIEEILENPEKAIDYLKQGLAFSPYNAEIWEHLGDDYGWLGRYSKAFQAYDLALKYLKNSEEDNLSKLRIKENVEKLKAEEIESRSDSSEDDEAIIPVDKRIESALRLLQINQSDFKAHVTLGHLYSKKQEYERAIPHFYEALKSPEERYGALTGMGVAFVAIGEVTTGFNYLGKAIKLEPENGLAWAQTMRSAMSNERSKLTEITFSKVKASSLPEEDIELLVAKYLLFHKKYDGAEELFNAILAKIPEESEAIEGLGMIAIAKGQFDKADKLFLDALTYEKDSVWYLDLRGQIAEKRKRPHLAIELYEKSIALRPLELDRYKILGNLYNQTGNRVKAFDTYSKALRMSPNDIEIITLFLDALEMGRMTKDHIELSLLLREKIARFKASEGDYSEAVTWLEKISVQYAEIAGRRAEALKLRTIERNRTSEEDERIIRDEINALNNEIRVRKLLAELYTDLDDRKKVKEQYNRLLELSPDQAVYVLRLADIYNEEGLHRTAKNMYKAIPIEKLEMRDQKKRAESFNEGGSKTDAVRQFKKMEAEQAPDDEVLTYLGTWQLDKGNRFRAEEYLRKALSMVSGNKEASEQLRKLCLEDRPDIQFEYTSGSDSDNMNWSDTSLLYRKMIDHKVLTFNLGNFQLKDRLSESTGPGISFGLASNPLKEFQWHLSIGQDPRTVDSGVDYSIGADIITGDSARFGLQFHNEGFGETALAAEDNVTKKGVLFTGELYASGAAKLFFEALNDKLSDGNKKTELMAGIMAKLVFMPGELTFKTNSLSYDFSVPYQRYYSPDKDSGQELTYSVSTDAAADIELSGAYTRGSNDGYGDYSRISLGFSAETSLNQLLAIEYSQFKADNSIHNGPHNFSSNGLNLAFNILY